MRDKSAFICFFYNSNRAFPSKGNINYQIIFFGFIKKIHCHIIRVFHIRNKGSFAVTAKSEPFICAGWFFDLAQSGD